MAVVSRPGKGRNSRHPSVSLDLVSISLILVSYVESLTDADSVAYSTADTGCATLRLMPRFAAANP